MIQQKENFLETISKIKNLAEKMVRWKGIETLLYYNYLSLFTYETGKLNIFEKIKCYSEICNIKDSSASIILLNAILTEISELNDEDLDLVENFIAGKKEETKKYGLEYYHHLEHELNQELKGKTLSMKQKYELAEKYSKKFDEFEKGHNSNQGYYEIEQNCQAEREKRTQRHI